jgi:hypothetical protein
VALLRGGLSHLAGESHLAHLFWEMIWLHMYLICSKFFKYLVSKDALGSKKNDEMGREIERVGEDS